MEMVTTKTMWNGSSFHTAVSGTLEGSAWTIERGPVSKQPMGVHYKGKVYTCGGTSVIGQKLWSVVGMACQKVSAPIVYNKPVS
jgi:hypothetical protein